MDSVTAVSEAFQSVSGYCRLYGKGRTERSEAVKAH